MIKDLKQLGIGLTEESVELAVPTLQAAEFIIDLRNKIDSYGIGDELCFANDAAAEPPA